MRKEIESSVIGDKVSQADLEIFQVFHRSFLTFNDSFKINFGMIKSISAINFEDKYLDTLMRS